MRADGPARLPPPPCSGDQHIHLLKMDCQGCELKALRGATKLLEAKRIHAMAFEYSPEWLRANGDEPIEVSEGSPTLFHTPPPTLTPADNLRSPLELLSCPPQYLMCHARISL